MKTTCEKKCQPNYTKSYEEDGFKITNYTTFDKRGKLFINLTYLIFKTLTK